MKRICHICKNNTKAFLVSQPFFRHLDFTTVSNSSKLLKCTNCQTISNPDAVNTELPTLETKEYANSHQTEQTMQIDGYTKPVTRSFLQAKILTQQILKHENARILDIGCFDGRLLVELDRMLNNADLWGFDINHCLESLFPEKDNFHFISTDLEDVNGQFDLITLSHSILYVPDMVLLMDSICRLLNNNGILFIQIPDISKNIYYSLMGDQSFIFTETSLKNVISKFGFREKVIGNNYFPRELLVSAKKYESADSGNHLKDQTFEHNIETIERILDQLVKMNQQNLAVLGTTVNAAFADEILGERIDFFVDENLSKIGETFRGKNIVHPKNLNHKNHTILPFGKSGIDIKNKFYKLYNGTFSVI